MSSKSSNSPSLARNISPRREEKLENREDPDSHKIFLTNLNGEYREQEVLDQVRRLFQKYAQVKKLSLKKHKNGFYYFGFLEYAPGFQAYQAIKQLDQYPLFGKKMKVRQDRQSEGCFYCKKMGHFARQCPENKTRRRSYSNQRGSRDLYERRRDDRYDRYDRRDRDYRDRQRDRSDRNDRNDRSDRNDRNDRNDRYDRDREYERDRNKHERRRNRSRSYSASKSSSESNYRRNRKEKKQRRKRRSGS